MNGTRPISEKEEYEAENYLHKGLANRTYNEQCYDEAGKLIGLVR